MTSFAKQFFSKMFVKIVLQKWQKCSKTEEIVIFTFRERIVRLGQMQSKLVDFTEMLIQSVIRKVQILYLVYCSVSMPLFEMLMKVCKNVILSNVLLMCN